MINSNLANLKRCRHGSARRTLSGMMHAYCAQGGPARRLRRRLRLGHYCVLGEEYDDTAADLMVESDDAFGERKSFLGGFCGRHGDWSGV
jgi:hypothetical protein